MINDLGTLQQRITVRAEESAALGAAPWNFLTEHLETGDIIDLLVLVEIAK